MKKSLYNQIVKGITKAGKEKTSLNGGFCVSEEMNDRNSFGNRWEISYDNYNIDAVVQSTHDIEIRVEYDNYDWELKKNRPVYSRRLFVTFTEKRVDIKGDEKKTLFIKRDIDITVSEDIHGNEKLVVNVYTLANDVCVGETNTHIWLEGFDPDIMNTTWQEKLYSLITRGYIRY
tara:strand:- start:228 stop:752 length:525 start_codon:yes stop_codon:yes gene_type:complete